MQYMKPIILLIFICTLQQFVFGQEQINPLTDITGLWKGTLYNDTTQLNYQYEIGISKTKSGYTGFSHTWFILDDQQYYGVKKVKVKVVDDKIIIEDDGLIANNYPVAPAKGVRQLNVLELKLDSNNTEQLIGPFTTNATKKFSVLTGFVTLKRKNDFWQSALVPHLQELNLLSKLSFVEDDKNKTETSLASNNKTKTKAEPQTSLFPKNEVVKTPEAKEENTIPTPTKEIANSTPSGDKKIVTKTRVKGIVKSNDQIKKVDSTITAKPWREKLPAEDINERITVMQHVVQFKSDSLQLSLYDNGEVDGDTVTVLLNGNVIMAKERLSTNAVKKTIYIPSTMDSVQLVMYAENLGSIPPNTGLLVVKDGRDTYEIRFTGDLQKNAGIIFRRKKE